VPSTSRRRLGLLGAAIAGTLFLAAGVAVGAVPRLVDVTPTTATDTGGAETAAAPSPVRQPFADTSTTTSAPPATAAPTTTYVAQPTTAKTVRKSAAPTTSAGAAPSATPTAPPQPAPAALPPGQRVNPTSAEVKAAIATLHQRIPMFAPTESQLRTFADAVCTSFDQGQTAAQVQATVRQAVTHIQGASLSASDAEFAVRIVVKLRCPGYLP
jgi:hypothetical protein